MSVKYGKFELPQKITIEEGSRTSTFTRFIAEPFERGLGIRYSILRVFYSPAWKRRLSSLFVSRECRTSIMAVEGIIEDMTNIILNFKGFTASSACR